MNEAAPMKSADCQGGEHVGGCEVPEIMDAETGTIVHEPHAECAVKNQAEHHVAHYGFYPGCGNEYDDCDLHPSTFRRSEG